VRMHPPAHLVVQGIKAGYQGQRVRFLNVGTAQVDFICASPSAAAPDRLFNFAISGATSIAPTNSTGGTVEYEYDTAIAGWRLVHHEQGGWIAPPFNAADYNGDGGTTWTVTAGGVARCAYYLQGRMLRVQLQIGPTTVGGVASGSLRRVIPVGFTVGNGPAHGPMSAYDNAPVTTGASWGTATAGTNQIYFTKDLAGVTPWTTPSAGGTHLSADLVIEVA
jgi:hypothetical protein